MIVKEPGIYQLTKSIKSRRRDSNVVIPEGVYLKITEIGPKKVTGPGLGGRYSKRLPVQMVRSL